jgi:nucleotide-binding universal stress UspA family protein
VASPAWLLIEQSTAASMVVVGARGRGGFAGMLAGSVASQLAAHAYGPVIVVRDAPDGAAPAGRPVVVGVDGSPEGSTALAFAMEEAAGLDVNLLAVHVWPALPTAAGRVTRWHHDHGATDRAAERTMLDQLAGWQQKYPEVNIGWRTVHGFDPGPALVTASHGAGLVVIGAHRHGRFAGTTPGSVTRALIHHAVCPVAVVHPDDVG